MHDTSKVLLSFLLTRAQTNAKLWFQHQIGHFPLNKISKKRGERERSVTKTTATQQTKL